MFAIKDASKLNFYEIKELYERYIETGEQLWTGSIHERVLELWDELGENVPPITLTISQLKKQIKHSKNPLEIKMLNKQLNLLYKRT